MSTPGPGVVVRVPAKVNLELRVGEPRDDGFHPLATVYQAVDLYDEVTVTPADRWGVEVHGERAADVPSTDDNLALKAVKALARGRSVSPVHVRIDKTIPVAGGMAGGSADAAAALVGADAVWGLGCERGELEKVAARLGSDVPFLLTGGTALGSGRGEQVVPALTQGTFHWVFVMHHEGLSTPAVYAECDRLREESGDEVFVPEHSEPLLSALRAGDVGLLALAVYNDLELPACSLLPRLRDTMAAGLRHGALCTTVSGSGPTVMMLAQDKASAMDLMVALSADGVGDELAYGVGPVAGAQVVRELGGTA